MSLLFIGRELRSYGGPLGLFVWALLCFWIGVRSLAAQDAGGIRHTGELDFDKQAVLGEVVEAVEKHFYRRDFDFDEWSERTGKLRRRALNAKTHQQFAEAVNEMLKDLKASHTHYFSRYDPKRYQLVGVFGKIFSGKGDEFFCYPGIGVATEMDPDTGYHRIMAVFDGYPAQDAGLRYGDLICKVNQATFQPIQSFENAGDTAVVEVQRNNECLQKEIPVVVLDGRTMFEKALTESVRVFERRSKQIGYVHAWSYAGSKYQELIRNELFFGKLSKCDGLILDLRDGWGGADLGYLNIFRDAIAEMVMRGREGPATSYSSSWNKPVVLLTNNGTTSGKELFSYGFKKLGLGKIVGKTTAGAVLAGRCFRLANDDILYLAVLDVEVDGSRLEGRGVSPDVLVERRFDNPTGGDEQIEAAIEVLMSPS